MTGAARAAVATLLVAVGMAACAAPSRRLTPRVVEDPIVLPRRMASVGLRGFAAHYEPTDARRNNLLVGVRYAFTDRLEWADLLSLRYALLDDRPVDGRPARPISLAVRAGATGIAYSSFNGLIVFPVASVEALKRIADRWALDLSVTWLAMWQQRGTSVFPSPPYTSTLGYAGNTASSLTLRGGATRQLAERVALGASASVTQTTGCLSSTCAWVSRGGVAALTVSVRPWHWVTLAAGPYVGYRYRPDGPIPPANPTAPVVIPLRRVEWVGLEGFLTFYW